MWKRRLAQLLILVGIASAPGCESLGKVAACYGAVAHHSAVAVARSSERRQAELCGYPYADPGYPAYHRRVEPNWSQRYWR